MTSPTSPSSPTTAASTAGRPDAPPDAALFDAIATEHGIIYGYGLVSAHSNPAANDLVSDAMREHRARREDAIALLSARGVAAPLPAPGYQVPSNIDDPIAAAKLALRMEEDAAAAWRAVLEQSTDQKDRAFAVTALTESAVTAARWRTRLGMEPSTVAFPGGSE